LGHLSAVAVVDSSKVT